MGRAFPDIEHTRKGQTERSEVWYSLSLVAVNRLLNGQDSITFQRSHEEDKARDEITRVVGIAAQSCKHCPLYKRPVDDKHPIGCTGFENKKPHLYESYQPPTANYLTSVDGASNRKFLDKNRPACGFDPIPRSNPENTAPSLLRAVYRFVTNGGRSRRK